jgi:tRNA(Ile)-lysidine synthase
LIEQVTHFCHKHNLIEPNDRIVVAVSGGADSVALLHLLLSLKQQLQLTITVAHLNHGLRGQAAVEDAQFVTRLAQQWKLAAFVETRPVSSLSRQRRQSLEETARQVRYAFLWQIAAETRSPKVAVGHSADDQAETVLMHLIRGSGLAGLKGMLPAREILNLGLHPDDIWSLPTHSGPQLIRPLLETPRSEIEKYCHEHRLSYRQDRSNQDMSFFRNRIRLELIPFLKRYNPNIQHILQNMASIVAADIEFFDQHLTKMWSEVVSEESDTEILLERGKWLALPLAMQRATLRQAIEQVQSVPKHVGFQPLENAIELVRAGKTGTQMSLPNGVQLRIVYNVIAISVSHEKVEFNFPHLSRHQRLAVNPEGTTRLPDSRWQLVIRRIPLSAVASVKHTGQWEAFLDVDVAKNDLLLRARQPGDKFHPLGMNGQRQKVKEFMINQKIPVQWRSHIPLLVCEGDILWICGYRIDHRARLTSNTQQVLHVKFETI